MDTLRNKQEYEKDIDYKNIIYFINKYPNLMLQSETENEEIFNIGRELDQIEARILLNGKNIFGKNWR